VSQILASELYPEPLFEYRRKKPDADIEGEYDVVACKFIGYSDIRPAELGQLVRVTVKTNEFSVQPEEIIPWLSKFGSVKSLGIEYERNSLGIRSDVFETELLLRKHIPEFLPIAGRKLQVGYPGIPKACNNCYQLGHMKRNCKNKKKEWLERVGDLRQSGEFEDELFGGWIALLDQA